MVCCIILPVDLNLCNLIKPKPNKPQQNFPCRYMIWEKLCREGDLVRGGSKRISLFHYYMEFQMVQNGLFIHWKCIVYWEATSKSSYRFTVQVRKSFLTTTHGHLILTLSLCNSIFHLLFIPNCVFFLLTVSRNSYILHWGSDCSDCNHTRVIWQHWSTFVMSRQGFEPGLIAHSESWDNTQTNKAKGSDPLLKAGRLAESSHYVAVGLRLRSPPTRRSEGIAMGGPHRFLDKG